MTCRFFVPALILVILAASFMQQLVMLHDKRDDFALMKYFAHATDASNAAVIAEVARQTENTGIRDRYAIRIDTALNYPVSTYVTKLTERILSAYSYAGVMATFVLTSLAVFSLLLFIRARYPSDYTTIIDLALVLVSIDLMLLYHDLSRFYPFGIGIRWTEIYPRGAIQLMFISYLYAYLSPVATSRAKYILFGFIALASLALNALFAAMIIGLIGLFALSQRFFKTLRFEYLFPALFIAFAAVYALAFDLTPGVVIRGALWAIYSMALLYFTRRIQDSFVRNLFIFFASISLASYFYAFDFTSQTHGNIYQFAVRAIGLTQFTFMLLLATLIPMPLRTKALAMLAVPLIVYAFYLATLNPLIMLTERLTVSEIPTVTAETDFFQYFTREAMRE